MNCCLSATELNDMAKKEYQYDNSYVMSELTHYQLYGQACEDYPFIDDIVTGAAHLDLGGNTRPLSVIVLWILLSNQPVLSTSVVMEATGKSLSHSKKIVSVLRVASHALEKELRKAHSVGHKAHGDIWNHRA